jgi:hypothetical protein
VEVRRLEQQLDIILQQLKDVEKLSRAEVRRVEQKLDTELAKYKIDVKKKYISDCPIFNYFANAIIY